MPLHAPTPARPAPVRAALALLTALAAVVALLGTTGAAPARAADGDLPVPYGFIPAALLAGVPPDQNPPGANDWNCRPSAAHPRPVVLVHGIVGNRATNWPTYAPLLKNNGYCVFSLTYGQYYPFPLNQFGGLGDIRASAQELKVFVDRVLTATGASEVDLVGHSEGTVMPGYYLKFLGGAAVVKRHVSIAPLWKGTDTLGGATLARLGQPFGLSAPVLGLIGAGAPSVPQLLAGSEYFAELRSGGSPFVPGVEYTNIVTKYDGVVTPYTSGIEDGATNITIQDLCPTDFSDHLQIVSDPVTARVVLNALDPANAQPVRCRVVLPLVGGLLG
ncbi:esterase/lipase family protein [Nocardioides sp.]|uniref:esterase/lipase family protein n=1 Tax=Nocardioides sp. TaxID=35761 RepID=UPI0035148F02